MQEVTEHFRGSGFGVFANQIATDDKVEVWAIPAKTGGSRAFCDRMNAWAQGAGPAGPRLYLLQGRRRARARWPRTSARSAPRRSAAQLGLADGDAVFFVLGRPEKMYRFAGEARVKVGLDLNLTQLDQFKLCWIVDFPFYEWSEEEKRVDFAHNPFSMPQGGLEALNGAGSADHQGLPVRRGVQRLRDRLGLDP